MINPATAMMRRAFAKERKFFEFHVSGEDEHHPQVNTHIKETRHEMGDGGAIQNIPLLQLLQRGVENVILFIDRSAV